MQRDPLRAACARSLGAIFGSRARLWDLPALVRAVGGWPCVSGWVPAGRAHQGVRTHISRDVLVCAQ